MHDTQYPGDDGGYLAALDFGDEPGYDSGAALDFGDEPAADTSAVLDFGDEVVGDGEAQASAIDDFGTDEPEEPANTGAKSAIDTMSEDAGEIEGVDAQKDDISWQLVTVTNPPGTVSVTSNVSGTIQKIDLSEELANMTESELEKEIITLADLAQKQAAGVRHAWLRAGFEAVGTDGSPMATDLLEALQLPSPEQADAVQATVFAARYAQAGE
jgi:hypothetical protein